MPAAGERPYARTMHPTTRSLAFLLSLGSLPIACNKDDKETDSTGGDTTTPSSDPTTSTGSSTGTDATDPTSPTPTTTGPDATTTGTTDGTETGATEPAVTTFLTSNTDGTDTGFDTDEPPPLPPPTDPTCLAYASHLVTCAPDYAQYRTYIAQYCEYYKMLGMRMDGQGCADAFEAYYVCLTNTDCNDFMEGTCEAESTAIEAACPSLGESSETEGSETTDATGSGGGGSTG